MSPPLIGIAIAIAMACLLGVMWLYATAPYGRQDSDGFHHTDENGVDL